jgi:hypothetical protein
MSKRKARRSGGLLGAPPLVKALYVIAGLSVVAAVVVIGTVVFGGSGSSTGFAAVPEGYPYPVQAIERIEQRNHFPIGDLYDNYNSEPPTSGPHAAAPANWGISDVPIAKEMAVHNMEHSGVVVWYNCNASPALDATGCTELRNQLGQVVQAEVAGRRRVLMTSYEGMDSRIALTSWGFLDTFDTFDADRVTRFIETFECNYDPESFC